MEWQGKLARIFFLYLSFVQEMEIRHTREKIQRTGYCDPKTLGGGAPTRYNFPVKQACLPELDWITSFLFPFNAFPAMVGPRKAAG